MNADVVHAKITATVAWSRGQTHLSKGRPFAVDAPLVRERPDLFEGRPSEPAGQRTARPEDPVVETATRAPGERRRTPRKKADT